MSVPLDVLQRALGDRYAVHSEVGQGGMGTVFKAEDRKHRRPVAIKVLRPELALTVGVKRFLREIEISASLSHPHIVPLYDSGEADGLLFYVMPYLEGVSLRDRIEREGPLGLDEAIRVTTEIASALSYAHARAIVHRDIKPANIMLPGNEAIVADFGVARAVGEAIGPDRTASGVVVGTAAYMSPEQAVGEGPVDGRTDVYALGCVLYEMLTGEPPFTGRSNVAVMAKHVHETVPSARTLRADLPVSVDAVVRKALAKSPADRFDSAEAFATALREAAAHRGPPKPRPLLRWSAAAFLAVAVLYLVWILVPSSRVDPSVYVIGTLFHEATSQVVSGAWLSEFESAMLRVPGARAVSAQRSGDRGLREGGDPTDRAGWIERARTLGAGLLITLTEYPSPAGPMVEGELRDLTSNTSRSRQRISLGTLSSEEIGSTAAELVERLFGLEPGVIARSRPSNLEAGRAFVEGSQARERWDFDGAQRAYLRAVELDRDFARANFWLAQVRAWLREPAESWVGHARRALAAGLSGSEATFARALVAMADEDYPGACRMYDSLLATDSANFQAWLGLAECNRRDPIVRRDPASPTEWSFRSSYHAAIGAYRRAFELAPSFAFTLGAEPVSALARTFFAVVRWRVGHPEGDARLFGAEPSLSGDTLAFVPYPVEVLQAGDVDSGTLYAALAANRQILNEVVGRWVQAFPRNVTALLAQAEALELVGTVGTARAQLSPLTWSQRAMEEIATAEDSLRFAAVHVRLLIKHQRFEDAGRLATDLVRGWENRTLPRPAVAASLAALAGRALAAGSFAGQAALAPGDDPAMGDIPLVLVEARERLMGFASVGAPADSIERLALELDAASKAMLPTERLRSRWCDVVGNALGTAYPVLGRPVRDSTCWTGAEWLVMQEAMSRRAFDEVARAMDRVDSARAGHTPGTSTIDIVYQEAWLLDKAGFSDRAVRHLDRWLDALPQASTNLTRRPAEAGSLVRAMALRAQLAAASGDAATARRWAAPVTSLWRNPDSPELRDLVGRMQLLASARSR